MTAIEARERATSLNLKNTSSQVAQIEALIEKAVIQGQLSVYYYSPLYPQVREHFEELGYKVNEDFNRNETLITITW